MPETRKFRSIPRQVEIRIPALPRATKESIAWLNDKFKWLKKDESPEEEVILTFATVLFEGEWYLHRFEFLKRMPEVRRTLGISQAMWLSENYHGLPQETKKVLASVFLDFPATMIVDVEDYDSVLYLHFDGEELSPFFDRFPHPFRNVERESGDSVDYIAVVKEI